MIDGLPSIYDYGNTQSYWTDGIAIISDSGFVEAGQDPPNIEVDELSSSVTAFDRGGNRVDLTHDQETALLQCFQVSGYRLPPRQSENWDIFYGVAAFYRPVGLDFMNAIGHVKISKVAYDSRSGIWNHTLDIIGGPAVFTNSADVVDFNRLTSAQVSAIQAGDHAHNTFSGDDRVSLPDTTTIPGSVDGWNPLETFWAGDGNDVVQGGLLDDAVRFGAGSDVYYASPGSDLVTFGSGPDIIDFRQGRFADLQGFGPSDVTVLNGGHARFETDSNAQSQVALPGSPDDYTQTVFFGGADSITTAQTVLETIGTRGFPRGIKIVSTGVEAVRFADPVESQVVSWPGSTIASEALQLAAEVYGPNPTLEHLAEPLAFTDGIQIPDAQQATTRGWSGVSAMQLGIGPADFGSFGNLEYSFSGGVYRAVDRSVHFFNGDSPEGDAMLLTGMVAGKHVLSITFRGTDQLADIVDYHNFSDYYSLFGPLALGIKSFVRDEANSIDEVIVSGHSLGAAMVQYLMAELPDSSSCSVLGVTAGSPGAEVGASDARIWNFTNAGDPVAAVPTASSLMGKAAIVAGTALLAGPIAGAAVAGVLAFAASKGRGPNQVEIDNDISQTFSLDEHSVRLYSQELSILSFFASDRVSPFSASFVAAGLRSGLPFNGSVRLAIAGVGGAATAVPAYAPGTTQLTITMLSESRVVHLQRQDEYALGNSAGLSTSGPDIFVWNRPRVSDVHIIDGGPGEIQAVVELPGDRNDYEIKTLGAETDLSLRYPLALADVGVVFGRLFRVGKIVFTGYTGHSGGLPVYNIDGGEPRVQLIRSDSIEAPIDHSFDYVDTGDASVTLSGSGLGDIVEVGSGDVAVNEVSGNNIILVKNPTLAGSLSVHAGSGDNQVFAGAGDDVLVGGSGNNFFQPGGGRNLIIGNGGVATVAFSANEDQFGFSSSLEADGSIATIVDFRGASGPDGTDVLVDVAKLEFTDETVSLVVGTSQNDSFSQSGVSSVFVGAGGDDVFTASSLRSQVEVSVDKSGDVIFSSSREYDVLVGIGRILVSGATFVASGNSLFERAADGAETFSTYNITGRSYTSTVFALDPLGQLLSARYGGVTGQAYQGFETEYEGHVPIATKYLYTKIDGQAYTSETLTVNAAGQQIAVAFGGLTSGPYSSYEYDYNAVLFTGSRFTVTAVPAGATYSSYEMAYNFANSYLGARIFYADVAGQPYTGEEIDTDPAGATTKVLLTGYSGQPYQTLELDYAAGAYTGYKSFATGITGQSYTGLEVDATAAGQLTKVVYSGLKTTPYTTLEQDYAGGALSRSTYTFNAPPGQSYSSYSVTQNAAGAQLSETVNNSDGSHTILGSAPNLIFEAIGNDRITGGGSGETFDFSTVFGHDTITDFAGHATGAGHDTISLSAADFTDFASVIASGQNVSGGVAFTGRSGSQLTLLGLDRTALAGLGADFTFHV